MYRGIRIPSTSEFLIESKSFKLYLNSFNQTKMASAEEVRLRMQRDLSAASGAEVQVIFIRLMRLFLNLRKHTVLMMRILMSPRMSWMRPC